MNFLIKNEDVFCHLLTFLSTQDNVNLTNANIGYNSNNHKLNSELVKFCCYNCSFDNVSVQFNLCTDCIIKLDRYNTFRYISYEDANRLYKFFTKKLDINILKESTRYKFVSELDIFVYDRLDIQKYVDNNFKTKLDRLLIIYKRHIAKEKRDVVNKKKKEAEESRKKAEESRKKAEGIMQKENYEKYKEEIKLYLNSNFSKEFIKYINKECLYDMYAKNKVNKKDIHDINSRYNNVVNKLKSKNLVLREDSKIAREYIKNNKDILKFDGDLENNVINEIEEINFLYTKCKYQSKLRLNLDFANEIDGFYVLKEQISMTKAEIFCNYCSKQPDLNKAPNKWRLIIQNVNISTKSDIFNNLSLDEKKILLYSEYLKYIKVNFEEDMYDELLNIKFKIG